MFSVAHDASSASGFGAQKSAFQTFVDGVQALYPDRGIREILAQYPTPQLVMIGSESTGKSATLENLTKKPIFPTHQRTCTRCPIKVSIIPGQEISVTVTFRKETHNVADIDFLKKQIEDLFNIIAQESASGYCEDEIQITFIEPNAVRIDLVDLPGLVSFPESAKKFTTDMCLKYIKDPNSLIICVAPATNPRLNSYEPIARILENKAEDRTIITLTMPDKLRPEDFNSQLLSRMHMTTDEFHSSKFLACCAVINRSSPAVGLADQADIERRWFVDHILAGASDADRAALVPWLGIHRLQAAAKQQYEKFLREKWVPRTAEEITKNIQSIEAKIADLGPLVTATTLPQLKSNIVVHSVGNTSVVEHMFRVCVEDDHPIPSGSGFGYPVGHRRDEVFEENKAINQRTLFGVALTSQRIIDQSFVLEYVKAACKRVDGYDLSPVLQKLLDQSWKLQRFTAYWTAVKTALKALISDCIAEGLRALRSEILSGYLRNSNVVFNQYLPHLLVMDLLPGFKEKCAALVTVEQMVEDKAVAQSRRDLQAQVQRLTGVRDALLQSTKEGRIEVVREPARK